MIFLLNDVIARVVLLVDLPRDGGHKLPSVGLTEGKESISLQRLRTDEDDRY